MKVTLMMKFRDGGSEEYESHEVRTIIDTADEYLLVLTEPQNDRLIEVVKKELFYLRVED